MQFFTVAALLLAIGFYVVPPVYRRFAIFGVFRGNVLQEIHGLEGLKVIPDTLQCEDVHHHRPTNKLYAACQLGDASKRYKWFPPLDHLTDHKAAGEATIVVVDPTTFKSTHLQLQGFAGPFVTHGIDVYNIPSKPDTVYIFAVNHLPNPEYYVPRPGQQRAEFAARSQIEVFRHEAGSSEATWIRSVRHPLITTPNDIFATSESSFYVTNDHHYRHGKMRLAEDLLTAKLAPWTNTVHVKFGPAAPSAASPNAAESNVEVTVALAGQHNNNGMGHTPDPLEVLLVDASGAVLTLARRDTLSANLTVVEGIQFDTGLDNPSYYIDEHSSPGNDASGYVLAGLPKAKDFPVGGKSVTAPLQSTVLHVPVQDRGTLSHWKWPKGAVFQDNGLGLKSASAAVIVGIDPAKNKGRKEGWLFTTGFWSNAMVATKIDLDRPVEQSATKQEL